MKIREIETMAGLAALLLVTASMAAPLHADSTPAGSASASPWLSLVGQPLMNYTGPAPTLTATFTNLSPNQANGTAFATVHDSIGQTVAIATVAIPGLNAGQSATLTFYLAVPLDSYTIDLFVLSDSGTLISADTTITVVA